MPQRGAARIRGQREQAAAGPGASPEDFLRGGVKQKVTFT